MINLKTEIYEILEKSVMILSKNRVRDEILALFNRWLRENDARNPDGDELRLEEE